jgi:putative PIN family toxin of toxin-antitoxin system
MHEIVLDTNVLVAAFRSKRGASYQVVQSIGRGDWRLNVSVALALEYEDVLKRQNVAGPITEPDVDLFLNYVFQVANLVPYVLRLRPTLRDPDDERILEVAVQCRAMIVTHNQKDFVGAERFGISVLSPAGFLRILRGDQ